MTYQTWSLVYGEQPSPAKWNILGSNDAHFYGFLGDNQEWQSWTPTLANLTLGNGTLACAYTQVGNTVYCRFRFVLGGTSAVGTGPTFTLPVDCNSRYVGGNIAEFTLDDVSAGYSLGVVTPSTTSVCLISCLVASGTYATRNGITSTVPFTWASGDHIAGNISYEAA